MVVTRTDLKTRFGTPTRQERDAWRELGSQWNLALADGEPCQAAQQRQVYCFKNASSSLVLIRQLDRPGILTLHDDEDQPVYALLTGLGAQGATLRIGGVSHTVSLGSLAEVWRGDFSTFWRAPPGYQKKTGGEPMSEWLAGRLATLQGTAPEVQSLKPRVQAFQLAQGLQADGVAGPVTLMQLNRATGVDEPRLNSEK
jgi:general secretion pathway protein A